MDIAVYRMTDRDHRQAAATECERAGYIVGLDDEDGVFLVVEHPGAAQDLQRVRDAVLAHDPQATQVD